jgi:hypothetical protein
MVLIMLIISLGYWPVLFFLLLLFFFFLVTAVVSLMNTGPIFREVTGKFDLWRSRRWRSGFKSDTIQTLQPLHQAQLD